MNHKFIDHIVSLLYPILIVSFFLPMKFQTWILIVCSILIVGLFVLSKCKISRNETIIAFLLGAGYFFYIAYIPLTIPEFRHELYKILEQKASFILLPFVILFLTKLSLINFKKYLILFPIGTACLGLATNVYILSQLDSSTWFNHVNYRIAFESISGIHPSYFGMFICFGIAICWLQDKSSTLGYYSFLILQLVLLITLLLLTPKSAIVALVIIFILRNFILLKKLNWTSLVKPILFIVFAFVLYEMIPFFHQRMNEVIAFASGKQHDLINNSMDMRNLIFNIDLALLKQHWIFGIGPIQLQKELNLLLQLSTSITGQPVQQYNTHNEYLNQWLCFGLAGFVYFISLIGIHLRKSISSNQYLYLFFIVILMVSFLTENVLSRQHGILFYALFSSLFFFSTSKN